MIEERVDVADNFLKLIVFVEKRFKGFSVAAQIHGNYAVLFLPRNLKLCPCGRSSGEAVYENERRAIGTQVVRSIVDAAVGIKMLLHGRLVGFDPTPARPTTESSTS